MNYGAWFFRNTQGIRLNIVLRMILGIGQTALGLWVVWLSKRFVDETVLEGSKGEIALEVGMLMTAIVAGVALRQVCNYLGNKAFIKKVAELRLKLFGNLFRRKLFDDDELHSGDVSSRMAKDIDNVSETMATTIPQSFTLVVQLVGAFLLMRWFDNRLAWALVLLTPLAIGIGKIISHKLRTITLTIRQDESRILAKIQESVEQNVMLRSLQGEKWMADRVAELQDKQNTNYIHRQRFMVVSRFALGCAFGLGYMLAFVWGAYGLRTGAISFGVMTSFLQLVGQIQHPILSLLNYFPSIIYSTASIDRLQDMETPEADSFDDTPQDNLHRPLGIKAEAVSFRYAKGDREVLKEFTYDFKPCSKTAILGTTGIGKTTLFRLVLGFISPCSGSISLYDSKGQAGISSATRRHLVFVPQGNTLMSGSIRNNLLVAKPDATDAELRQALTVACAEFVFQLPKGIDTELGEHGGGLSEGQAQRIAIARGLLRDGSILLLDEISSALDEATERELFSRLFASRPDTTVLLITHRDAVASLCDNKASLSSQ